ncbi:MAG: rhomboid family intramembrane serine protease [Bacilli bacterium]|nr:rhomboid family intramembrane serine protease [Bacilli bacterium]
MKIVNGLDNLFSFNSVVTLSFFAICLVLLIIDKICRGKLSTFFSVRRGSIFNPMTYIRFVTSSFVHENWQHFSGNFLYILLLGPMLEEKYGGLNLIYMMLVTTVASSLVHVIFSKKAALGASDITFMMIILSSIVNIQSGKIPITLVLIILFYVVGEVIDGITKKDNISHLSHIVGAICGVVFGYYFL